MRARRAALLIAVILLAASQLPAPAPEKTPVASRPEPLAIIRQPQPISLQPGTPALDAVARTVHAASIRSPRVVTGVVTSQPVVALTFDLDMTPEMVAQVRNGTVVGWINQDALAVLRNSGTHATLFMTGMWAELYPGLARSLALDPNFEIANHSYSHPAFHRPCYLLSGLGPGGAPWQLAHAQAVLGRITGVTPTYFRFPGGCYDPPALDAVHAAGLTPVQWTVNAMDAFNPNPVGIAANVLSHIKPGAIVVMHLQGGPNAPATGTALRLIIPALQHLGYQFVTVSELLRWGAPLQPAPGREVVEAYQPVRLPTPTPAAPAWSVSQASGVVPLRPAPPIRPCWRWDARLRAWIRC